MLSPVFDRAQLRRPLTWLLWAGFVAAGGCATYDLVAYGHTHRVTVWLIVGMGLLIASELAAITTGRTRRR
jgi:hypothetical protein